MPQLSLYLDDAAMDDLRAAAKRENASLSQYARSRISSSAGAAWPSSFWSTYGALDDPSFVAPSELDPALDGQAPIFD